jgi:GH24 family phage-related lysozyme (muramidase)
MQTSKNGIVFIKANEGFAAEVYTDNGKQAIGYGHDLLPGEEYPDGITEQEADTLLRKDLRERFEPAVNAVIPATCSQNQFDSLCDFCFNLGPGALRTMVAHGWEQVPDQMLRWNYSGGKPSPALLERREKEVQMFNS